MPARAAAEWVQRRKPLLQGDSPPAFSCHPIFLSLSLPQSGLDHLASSNLRRRLLDSARVGNAQCAMRNSE